MSTRVLASVVALLVVGALGYGLGLHRASRVVEVPASAPPPSSPPTTATTGAGTLTRIVRMPVVAPAEAPAPAPAPVPAPCDSCAATRVVDPELVATASEKVPPAYEAVAATPEETEKLRGLDAELHDQARELAGRMSKGELTDNDYRQAMVKLGEERRNKLESVLGAERAAIFTETNALNFKSFAGEMVTAGAVVAPAATK